ncbi:tyrosine-type recombinase/integrase [Alsobacter sp. R-9]
MSLTNASRSYTLSDVAVHIGSVDMPPRRRGEMLSALRTVARVLGRPLDAIPADPRALTQLTSGVSHLAHGISAGRWANTRSLAGKALELVQPVMPSRQRAVLLPEWDALLGALGTLQRRYALSAGLRWLSAQGIAPAAVTGDDLERLRTALLETSLRARPHEVWARFAHAWNAARASTEGWPDVAAVVVDRRKAVTLPWTAFPASLQRDAEAWLSRQAGHDIMDEDGPPKPLRPTTIESYRYLLRSVASSAVAEGIEAASLTGLADLVKLPVYKAALLGQWKRTGRKASSALSKVAAVLISVGRYWVKLPEAELKALRDAARRVEPPKRRGLTQKNLDRLRPFDNPRTTLALLTLPFAIRKEVGRGKLTPRKAAQKAQAAIAIALLLIAPMRLKNLRLLSLDRHLVRHGKGLHLVIPGEEVKNEVDLEFEVERQTRDLLQWYLDEHRPLLGPAGSSMLFPGGVDGAKDGQTMRGIIKRAIRRHTGLEMNPHLFRHFAAKLYLDRNPGDYETVRRLLGHKSIETTIRFYAGFETKAATKHYQGVVIGLRGAGERA